MIIVKVYEQNLNKAWIKWYTEIFKVNLKNNVLNK
jgi:hypothetical protein